jgi:hypothetical protein
MLQLALPQAGAQLPPVPEESAAKTTPAPRLFVPQRTHDLGVIFEGDKPTVHWILENHGSADLIIERTRAGCGCTVVQLAKEDKLIPPGGSLELSAEFNTNNRRGAQTKHVTVYSNDPAEPSLKLTFTARIEALYNMKPPTMVNLRSIRRGDTVNKIIEFTPGVGRKTVEILSLEVPDDSPVSFGHEPFDAGGTTGQRIRITVDKNVSLGTLMTSVSVKLSVDGIEKERVVPIRGQVVGDVTWTPKTVDATRQAVPRGQRLAPVTIQSTGRMPFDILGATAGPLFDVVVERDERPRRGSRYSVLLTLRDDAPPGPFGTALEVRTNLADQPIVRVPVFGIVARAIEVDPPMILLRQDGTPAGTHRRIKLQTLPQFKLDVSAIACNMEAVVAAVDWEASQRYSHLRYLDVRLVGKVPPGVHQAVLTVTTNIEGAERLEIPLTVDASGGPG